MAKNRSIAVVACRRMMHSVRSVVRVLLIPPLFAAPSAVVAAPAPSRFTILSADLIMDGAAVRVLYQNGKSFTDRMGTESEDGQYGLPTISQDRLSVGWTKNMYFYGHSNYAYPVEVDVLRNGKFVWPKGACEVSGIPFQWHFIDGGKRVVEAFSFPHGVPYEHRVLIDADTGFCEGVVSIDNDTNQPPPNAPAWASNAANPE